MGAVGEVTRAPSGDRWGLHRLHSIRQEGLWQTILSPQWEQAKAGQTFQSLQLTRKIAGWVHLSLQASQVAAGWVFLNPQLAQGAVVQPLLNPQLAQGTDSIESGVFETDSIVLTVVAVLDDEVAGGTRYPRN